MASDNLRRSSRRNKKRSYSVGDIVEIVVEHAKAVFGKGRLLSKLTDTSGNARWVVALDTSATESSSSWTTDEMHESCFGEIMGKLSQEELTKIRGALKAHKKTGRAAPVQGGNNKATNSSNNKNDQSNRQTAKSTADEDRTGNNKKRKTRASSPNSPVVTTTNNKDGATQIQSDVSTPSSDISKKAARASAREERSRRRQALMEDELNGFGTKGKNGRPNKKQKKHNPRHGDDVVVVQLLTGVLYLYRGIPRRAEFVRKV